MYWQEQSPQTGYAAFSDMLDLAFNISCRELVVDHAYLLSQALLQAAPILASDKRIGIHSIHLAGSQNGWERPNPALGQKLTLSKRTKLYIRIPKALQESVSEALNGVSVRVGDDTIQIGQAKAKPLSQQNTLFCRNILLYTGELEDEAAFLKRVISEVAVYGVTVRKALCGMIQSINTPAGIQPTRSLMLADLSTQDALKLQQLGVGEYRQLGCGIFLPHKGISAVTKAGDE